MIINRSSYAAPTYFFESAVNLIAGPTSCLRSRDMGIGYVILGVYQTYFGGFRHSYTYIHLYSLYIYIICLCVFNLIQNGPKTKCWFNLGVPSHKIPVPLYDICHSWESRSLKHWGCVSGINNRIRTHWAYYFCHHCNECRPINASERFLRFCDNISSPK